MAIVVAGADDLCDDDNLANNDADGDNLTGNDDEARIVLDLLFWLFDEFSVSDCCRCCCLASLDFLLVK